MPDMTKKQIIQLLSKVSGEMIFKKRIPQRNSIKKGTLDDVVSHFKTGIITPNVISEVINDLAFDEVLEKVKSDNNAYDNEVKLKDISEINVSQIAEKVYLKLKSLPAHYKFILKLPKCSQSIPSIKLSHNIELLTANKSFSEKVSGKETSIRGFSDLLSNLHAKGQKINSGDCIVLVEGNGYISDYYTIKLDSVDPLYIWKVIVGVYAALEIIKRQDGVSYQRLLTEFNYDVYSDDFTYVRSFNESTEDSQYLSRMGFNPEVFELTEIDKLLKKTQTRFDYANEVLTNLFSKFLFAKGKTDKKVIKQQIMIKNGSYWFYESLKTQQEHIRAIYMTTAFDSLLGARGNQDTKEAKAELISVSVAKDSLEADSIKKAVIDLYALRNDIVHGSKEISALEQYTESDEKNSLASNYYAEWILSRFLSSRIHFVNAGLSKTLTLGVTRS